jgi:hypothetical protein
MPANLSQPSLKPKPLLRRLLHLAGVDRAIGYTVLARGWASVAGLFTVFLIARSLSPAEQGYYYTFGALVAMQIIFELGFSVVILQLAAHEAAHLTISADGHITGPEAAHRRLASILRKTVKWYSVAAILVVCFLIPVGWHFFASNTSSGAVAWRSPWICVVLASGITFQIDPVFSFLEGCGMVARVARARLAQSMLGSLLAWSALLLHFGLFAPALLIAGQAIAGVLWLSRRHVFLLGLFRSFGGDIHIMDWWQEVWPFQWRIAVSYACGFFIFQLFNPVLFHYWGPTVAGRMGMSLNISNAIGSIAIAWINTKAAPFGSLIARHDYRQLDSTFFGALRQSLCLSLLLSAVAWLGTLLLIRLHSPFAQRILSPLPFGLLLLSMNINQVVASMALYLRAHKQEKFLLISVIGAIYIAASAIVLGRLFGPLGITAGQFVGAVVIGLGFGSYVFLKYRRLWHAI